MKKLIVLFAMFALSACAGKPGPVGNIAVPQPAKPVELEKYLGRWYEMARYEAPFQRGCEAVTADYSLKEDGGIKVINRCLKNGKFEQAIGKAKLVEASNGSKLKVSFFGPFYGDYWVLDRADDYSWSIVGEPSGRYLWILTRAEKPDATTQKQLEMRVKTMGYDWSLIRMTQH